MPVVRVMPVVPVISVVTGVPEDLLKLSFGLAPYGAAAAGRLGFDVAQVPKNYLPPILRCLQYLCFWNSSLSHCIAEDLKLLDTPDPRLQQWNKSASTGSGLAFCESCRRLTTL
eukprot:GHVT01008725.1.p1 GENE.GHVT01008725.1~~GHVT01008725.1.p1  ORF type:complete len:114 (-),score=4.70 GHVT01008725.1:339-680(-)